MQAMDTAPEPQPAFATGPGGERSVMASRPLPQRTREPLHRQTAHSLVCLQNLERATCCMQHITANCCRI